MKRVIPFSSGTQAMDWFDMNCLQCKTSKNCSAKRNIEEGFITGDITIKAAKYIGIAFEHPNQNYVTLYLICGNKDKRKIKKNIDNLKLF